MILFYIIAGMLLLAVIVLLIPLRGRQYEHTVPVRCVDERDTMFARNEIKPGSDRYNEYYSMRPENLEPDLRFRARPGLLSDRATHYNRYAFAAARASFEAVEAFFQLRENIPLQSDALPPPSKGELIGEANIPLQSDARGGQVLQSGNKNENSDDLTVFVKEWGKKMGAHSVGIAEMRDYHYYTVGGRRERYGVEVINRHRYGIAITVEMDNELTATAPQGGIVMESAYQYLRSGMIATQLAITLRNLGYSAKTHIDANYDVICPLVAKDAGLGEIGRMGLLMTPKLGPRVRIAVVTTDAPLLADTSTHDDTLLDFCTHCMKCAAVCPSSSIPGGDREEHPGGLRWRVDQAGCFTYWCQAGTDCGRCMAVCPYSHIDNLFHRMIRWGISNNFIFRRLAVRLDDLFYGTRPAPGRMPEWSSEQL